MLARPFRIISKLFRAGRPEDERRKKLGRLEQTIGYSFQDINLLETALSHLSYVNETGLNYSDSNERLEFLGDAIVNMLVSEYLYRHLHSAREGELTRIKSSIVSRSALARKAARLKLEDYIIYSKESVPDLRRSKKTLISNALEAIIGAIYLDGGLLAARNFVNDKLFDRGKLQPGFDNLQEAKNSLLHLSQVNYHCQPSYRIAEITGPEHARQFACEVTINGKIMGRGVGSNKKESEKRAAMQALELLANLEPPVKKGG